MGLKTEAAQTLSALDKRHGPAREMKNPSYKKFYKSKSRKLRVNGVDLE